MAKKGGVNLNAFFDGVRASAGNSYVFETEVPLMFNQTFDPGFFIELHCKDLGIARDIHTAPGTGIEPSKYDEVYKVGFWGCNHVDAACVCVRRDRTSRVQVALTKCKLNQHKTAPHRSMLQLRACTARQWTSTVDALGHPIQPSCCRRA